MKKSVKIRKIIFEILYEIYQKNVNFDESFLNFTKNINLTEKEKAMIYNIVLNSIRNNFFIQNILKKYLRKKTSIKVKTLIVSAITQIIYLGFKEYAVTFDTVEIAKIKKLNPGLINSLLKNIINDKNIIDKQKIDLQSIPLWFRKVTNKNNINLFKIIENTSKEPSLHLVFKNKEYIKDFNEDHVKTTEISAFLNIKKKIGDINNYKNGHWWVQDFSSMLPVYLSPEINSKNILDMCAAPGGKAFQVISKKNKVTLNDVSKKRINILKTNLDRLSFNNEITNIDALDISEKKLFDVVLLDSPCSGIGTLRRNPEILFKKKPPDLDFLVNIQKKLISKAAKLLKKNGVLLYMVCSFLHEESKHIKKYFLNENKNFSQLKFKLNKKDDFYKFIDIDGDIYCTPTNFRNYMVDGFYAVKFKKND